MPIGIASTKSFHSGATPITDEPFHEQVLAHKLQRMTQETDTRYLIVTHNAVTMSRMDRLYGVTMIEKGISRLVSVDLGGAETLLAAE